MVPLYLCSSHNESLSFNGSGPQERFPMSLAGRNSESGRICDDLGAKALQVQADFWKAQLLVKAHVSANTAHQRQRIEREGYTSKQIANPTRPTAVLNVGKMLMPFSTLLSTFNQHRRERKEAQRITCSPATRGPLRSRHRRDGVSDSVAQFPLFRQSTEECS